MGQQFFPSCQLETKRLLWLIGITFSVILAFQYLELPYGNVLRPLFSTSKIPTAGSGNLQTADSPSKSNIFSQSNLTGGYDLEIANNTRTSEEKEAIPKDGFVLETRKESNKSLGFQESDKSYNVDTVNKSNSGSATEQAGELGQSRYNNPVNLNYLTSSSGEGNITLTSEHIPDNSYADSPSPSPAIAPTAPTPPISPPTNVTISESSNDSSISLMKNESISTSGKDESIRSSQDDVNIPKKNSSINRMPEENKDSHLPIPEVATISDMNKLLLQSRESYSSMRPRWSSTVDQELLQVRSEIQNAPIVNNDPSLYAPIYRNVSMFKRSYELMEKTLKVYVYREGARPILHSPFLSGIYASEGWFMKLMEANKRFVTKDPKKAHLFYMPFSSRMLEETLYVQNSHSHKNLIQFLNTYVDMISGKYPFWNRTEGADHFLVACHDWAPAETKGRMAKCIRALCNADVKENFVFGKDVSLPETYIRNIKNPTKDLGGNQASKKTTLAFFAGSMHGYVRPIMLQHWENKDPDMKIFGRMPKTKGNRNYIQYMKSSKYCICAKGYEVNSPRVVEAIFYECVPVIISDNFVPPFFEVLNWESFAVFVLEKDIPNLKSILLSIPEKSYLRMLMRVKKVQQHFLWHTNPVKYDIFHMILHSIWYNRVYTVRAR